jgi:hypothetical protein
MMDATQHIEHDAAMSDREITESQKMPPGMPSKMPSHMLAANDPDNPMNWPLHRRLYASFVAVCMAFAV